ncbi:MAG: aspartate/glutamate racemase family protein, partial [Thermodesulfobacteriota bacterium]|nr:aspartate/glutamate racemase family protein [Thermodesulfobacteriota bacterium]
LFQAELADSVSVPVFTSSLMQVPLIQKMLKKNQTIGIITAKKSSLTARHLKKVGIDDKILLQIEGLESCTEWSKIFLAPEEDIDISIVEKDVVNIACAMKKTSDIGAFVLECTDLPPFSDAIRKATDCPVFDFVTLTNFVYRALKGS